ncbi:hypothetical protein [Roseobacter sp.]|uniref:hypothetical protein n=1 Tax=Roseobacter sp. TaxID=1907202 RepID=UPI0032974923
MRYDWPRDLVKSADRRSRREEFNQSLRESVGIDGELDWLDLLRALMAARAAPPGPWLPLGPSAVLRGQADGDPMVAGRVRELFVNREGTRAYAGSANGGVWYWEDSHVAWRPVGAWGVQPGMLTAGERAQLSLTVGALHVEFGRNASDVDDPAGDVIYAGTGELRPGGAGAPGSKHAGIGVLKLEDTINAVLADPGGIPWQVEGGTQMRGRGIYRLARNPGFDGTATSVELVSATSNGLFFRQGNFVAGADWQQVPKSKFNHDDDDVLVFTDALWSESSGLWVGMVTSSGPEGLYHAPSGPTGAFNRIDLDKLYGGSVSYKRLALCQPDTVSDRLYVLGKRRGRQIGHSGLWRVNISGSAVTSHLVADVPRSVFASDTKIKGRGSRITVKGDQAHYDMAIEAVADTAPGKDTVYVAGAYRKGDASMHALMVEAFDGGFRADFDIANEATPGDDDTFAGIGIHADVHQMRMRPNGLWVACDGGVFLRRPDETAVPRNLGLAVTEPGYIDSYPKMDGRLLAGLQDNAVIEKSGDTVWHRRTSGDGGGVAYHPLQPKKFLEQFTHSDWSFREANSEISWASLDRVMTPPGFADDEDTYARSFFYSKSATAPGPGTNAQVCIGTDRLWYTQDWGAGATPKWVTLPSGKDPADGLWPGVRQDQIERFRVIRFADPGTETAITSSTTPAMDGSTVLALSDDTLFRFTLTVNAAGDDATWTKKRDARISGDRPSKQKYAEDDLPAVFLNYLPRPSGMSLTDVASHEPARGSCYVATTGKSDRPDGGGPPEIDEKYDTLWWFDGEGRWYPTGLVSAPIDAASGTAGVRASAHSVIVDPDGLPDFGTPGNVVDTNRQDYVYVGTRLGVWRGRLTFTEIPADPANPDQPTWQPSWSWEPFFDGLPQTLVEDLSIYTETRPAFGGLPETQTKLLRAALISRGVWEMDLGPLSDSVGRPFLRTSQLDTGRRPIPIQSSDHYSGLLHMEYRHAHSPDVLAWNYDRRATLEANRMEGRTELTEPDTFDTEINSKSTLKRRLYRKRLSGSVPANIAEVLVHHRVLQPIDTNEITVHLFAWTNRPFGINLQDMPLSTTERAAIKAVVDGGPMPVQANLLHLGSEHPIRPVDARMTRPAQFAFDLDYPFDPANTLSGGGVLPDQDKVILIAVLDAPGFRLSEAALSPDGVANPSLVDLTRRSSLIAASTYRRIEEQP